ncbi:hypothetical protein OF83DRAFT_533230 [Amylostereum chailletii]|nr:hypothetical protein OF83DRAFT_533230 [Amylostereum chailletii]
MISLPVELQIKIFQRATHVPNLLDIVPDPNGPFLPECPDVSLPILIDNFSRSLPTRHALPLVCRAFNDVATPLLYQCLLLNTKTVPMIAASLKTYNLSLVRHLIIDLPISFPFCAAPEILAIFTALPAGVQILSINTQVVFDFQPPYRPLPHFAVLRAMARTLGPSLRKLTMDQSAVQMFPRPEDLNVFTQALANLETIVLRVYFTH